MVGRTFGVYTREVSWMLETGFNECLQTELQKQPNTLLRIIEAGIKNVQPQSRKWTFLYKKNMYTKWTLL